MDNKKQRLDLYLVENGLVESRSKAQELVKSGFISVNENIVLKANKMVSPTDDIKVLEKLKYVSRAGEKLATAINHWKLNLADKVVLDIGASTGGFTDCALQNNAKHVFCVDVGINQLHHSLINNPKVTNYENTNIRIIDQKMFDMKIDFIVCDVSFISLSKVLPIVAPYIDKQTLMVALIKPQFELDQKIVGKHKGLVRDKKYHDKAIANVRSYVNDQNLKVIDVIESPIKGNKLKNTEFLALIGR